MNKREIDQYRADKYIYHSAFIDELLERITYRDHILKAQKELSFRLSIGIRGK